MRAFHENPNRIHIELTFLNPDSAQSQNLCFCRPLKYLKPHRQTVWTQILLEQSDLSVDPDQTAPVGAV